MLLPDAVLRALYLITSGLLLGRLVIRRPNLGCAWHRSNRSVPFLRLGCCFQDLVADVFVASCALMLWLVVGYIEVPILSVLVIVVF